VVECLPSKCEALSSNLVPPPPPPPPKKKKRKKKSIIEAIRLVLPLSVDLDLMKLSNKSYALLIIKIKASC
jgi:hypothetical protein